MLKLTRKVGENVMIGDDVVLTVLAIDGNQIRLGVDAPNETAVHREEVYLRIHGQEARSGKSRRIGEHPSRPKNIYV